MATKLADSNIANLGSKEEKAAKLAAAEKEPAFKGAGQKEGVQVWRVEKLKIAKWPQNQYGSFYSGDAYIVLYTWKESGKNVFKYNAHFWLGKNSSQDEQGIAAYKTVELDDLLGGAPVQQRELEGDESKEFISWFGGKIRILSGGIESGFNSVKPTEYKPRLFHIKGRKENSVRIQQVPLAVSSLNSGDVFVLDAGMTLYIWRGKTAGMFEKRKGTELATEIDNERGGKPQQNILEEGQESDDFWKLLGGKGTIAASTSDEEEVKATKRAESDKTHVKKLIKLSDASGTVTMAEVQSGSLSKSKLDANDCFIVDSGSTIFVWIGSKASSKEKAAGYARATSYLVSNKRPANTKIVQLNDGHETAVFKSAFVDY